MQTPEAIAKSYFSRLDHYQNKLLLKDNGGNTAEILAMIRFLEHTRLKMLDTKTPTEAIEIYRSMGNEKVALRMKKYGIEI